MRQLLALLIFIFNAQLALAEDWQVRHKVSASFEDARDAIVMAIESRGLVINYVSHLGEMLKRTGADLGSKRQIFEQAESIEFCSARLSRQMLEADPHNIVLCPFVIAIYTLPGEKNMTWISYRKPEGSAANIVGPMLQEIAAEAGR